MPLGGRPPPSLLRLAGPSGRCRHCSAPGTACRSPSSWSSGLRARAVTVPAANALDGVGLHAVDRDRQARAPRRRERRKATFCILFSTRWTSGRPSIASTNPGKPAPVPMSTSGRSGSGSAAGVARNQEMAGPDNVRSRARYQAKRLISLEKKILVAGQPRLCFT